MNGLGKILYSHIHEITKAIYKHKEMEGNVKGFRHRKDINLSHVTYCVSANAGDTALSQCVRRTFEKHLTANWEIIRVSDEVNEELIRKINNTKALVIGGGGLFLPDTNRNMKSGWQWAAGKEELRQLTVPVIVFSVGYNYFRNQTSSELFRESLTLLCEKAQFIGLRNHGSIEAVKSLLPVSIRDKILYQPCPTTLVRKIYGNYLQNKVPGKKIAINIAFDREEQRFGENKEIILKEVAKAAKMIEDRGYEIVLVYHVHGDQKIKSYMDAQEVHYTEKELMNAFPRQIFKFYNEIDLVIGMRGHAQMIPFGLNCEIISLKTHDKIQWFLEDIDAIDWQIDLMGGGSHGLSEKIVGKFVQVHEIDHELTRARLYQQQDKLWEITQNNMKTITRIIDGY